MQREMLSRRSVLTLAGGCTLAGVGVAGGSSADDGLARDGFAIREGTDEETTVYVATAAADGPTAVVVGGVHGNEVAGYAAAGGIADWTIDAGTLLTIPEANVPAIDRGTRTGEDGVDLNRQFPEGSEPETDLARAIWGVVAEYDADLVVDLHESTGIYAGDPVDGVGQAIFHDADGESAAAAADAAEYVTRTAVDDPDYAFRTGRFSGPDTDPEGLLVHKAARDRDADAFLVETLSTDVALETRVQWHSMIVERLLTRKGLLEESDNGHVPDEPVDENPGDGDDGEDDDSDDGGGEDDRSDEPDRESPIARIASVPENAADRSLEAGRTVVLDGTCSCAPDGEIVEYEWDVGRDACFDETGATIEVTIGANGRDAVVLRVVDDGGRTDTASITLSTD